MKNVKEMVKMICKSAIQIIEENVEGIKDIPHTKDNVFFCVL